MIECHVIDDAKIPLLKIEGRIDSMSAHEIQAAIDELIDRGILLMAADLENVNYVSSAGLRVFLAAQKLLKKAGGEVILLKMPDRVLSVFKMSGFDRFFTMAATDRELHERLSAGPAQRPSVMQTINGIPFEILPIDAMPGVLTIIGSQDKLLHAEYDENDVRTVGADQILFGTGLAALGEHYEDYAGYFGEAVVLNRNFFYYPAVKRSVVDYILCGNDTAGLQYRFLHGFGFSGNYSRLVSFNSPAKLISLAEITDALFEISPAALLGIVFLGESKGFWGMNLKKIPLGKNRPANGRDIFDPQHFPEWINFPVEPSHINHLIAGCGIAVRDKNTVTAHVRHLFSQESNIHMHAGIFGKEPFHRNIERFDSELDRIITGTEALKIQHVLPKSLFSQGMLALVELNA